MEEKKNNITTIKLSRETKARLDNFKVYRRETYEEIVEKVLQILNLCRASPERAKSRLIAIDRQRRKSSKPRTPVRIQNRPQNNVL